MQTLVHMFICIIGMHVTCWSENQWKIESNAFPQWYCSCYWNKYVNLQLGSSENSRECASTYLHHFSTTPLTWPCIWRLRKWKASGRWCWHIRVTLQIVFILSLTVVANNIVWWLFHFTVRPENGIINCISICCAIHAMCWKYSFRQKDIIVIYLFASTKQRGKGRTDISTKAIMLMCFLLLGLQNVVQKII